MAEKNRLQYRPEIDGLRAIAVIPVLLFHAGLGFPGGYTGVDVFFVISGYLIGSLILREGEEGTFSFRRFWGRRLRRLFPAWAVVVAGTTVAAWFWLIPTHLKEYGESLISQPLLVANFYFWRQSGYFETASDFQPLLHTWSLAVEEQFYLLLPLFLLPFIRLGRRAVVLLVLIFVVASLGLSLYLSPRNPGFAFFLLPTRIFELNIGVLLAWFLLANKTKPRFAEAMTLLGLIAILLTYFIYDKSTLFPGIAAAIPCLGAAAIILGNSSELTLTGKFLSNPLLVWIGKISYPLYLWHWPVLVFINYLRIGEYSITWSLFGLGLSVFLAWLTYRFIETPVREKRIFPVLRPLIIVSIIVSVFAIAAGLFFRQTKGVPGRFSSEVNELLEVQTVPFPMPSSPPLGDTSPGSPGLLLWGDSHADVLKPVLHKLGKEYGVRVVAAIQGSIAPIPNTYPRRRRGIAREALAKAEAFSEDENISIILLASRWPNYVFGGKGGDLGRILQEEGESSSSEKESGEILVRNLSAHVGNLEASGKEVWLMRCVGIHSRSVPETLAQVASRGGDLNTFARPIEDYRREGQPINDLLDEALKDHNVAILDPLPFLTDAKGRYLMAKEGVPLYEDQDHLSVQGALELEPLFEPMFKAIAESAREGK